MNEGKGKGYLAAGPAAPDEPEDPPPSGPAVPPLPEPAPVPGGGVWVGAGA